MESNEGKAANQRLDALRQKLAADLAAKQKELQQDQARPVAQRDAELQKVVLQSQNEFTNAQRQAQIDLRNKVNPIIAEIAGQQGAEVVLNTDTATAWSSPQLDITNEVI